MSTYKRRFGDRKEGRLLRSLPAFSKFIPYIMPTRNDASNQYEESFEVSDVDRRLRQLRVQGYKGIGILHFIIAAYIRGVSMLPGINRFVVGRRIYARDDISVVMTVKRSLSVDATETTIKVHFEPTDTIFDVYRKMNEKIDEIKASDENNNTEAVAETFCRAPRFLLRFALAIVRMLDYFGWLPESLTEASPFHGSMIITDLGSLRIGPIFHHIYTSVRSRCSSRSARSGIPMSLTATATWSTASMLTASSSWMSARSTGIITLSSFRRSAICSSTPRSSKRPLESH
ncbi:MAG: hypothetical protein V8S87_02410 [Oscillospiraceae bacterium]